MRSLEGWWEVLHLWIYTDHHNSQLSPLFARGLAFKNKQIATDRDVAILVEENSVVNIIVPEQSSHAANLIGLPAKQIASFSLIQLEQTSSHSNVAVQVDLRSVSRNSLHVNARPELESCVMFSFESEKEAFQMQRVLRILVQQATGYEDLVVYESIIDNQGEDQEQPEDSLDYVLDSMGNKFADKNPLSQQNVMTKDGTLLVAMPNNSSQSQRPRSILQSYIESGRMKDNDATHKWPATEAMPSKNVGEADTTDEDTNGDEVELVPKAHEKGHLPGSEVQKGRSRMPYAPQTEYSSIAFPDESVTNAIPPRGARRPQKEKAIQRHIDPKYLLFKGNPLSNVSAKIPKPAQNVSARKSNDKSLRNIQEDAKIPSLIAAANVHSLQPSSRPGDTTSVSAFQVPCSPPLSKSRQKQLADLSNNTSTAMHRHKKNHQSKAMPGEGSPEVGNADQLWNEALIPEDARPEKHAKKGNQSKKRSTKHEIRKPIEDKQQMVTLRLTKGTSKVKGAADKDFTSQEGISTRVVPKRNAAARANKRIEKQIESESIADGKALDQLAKDSDIQAATVPPPQQSMKSNKTIPDEENASLDAIRQSNATRKHDSKSDDNEEDQSSHNNIKMRDEINQTEAPQAMTCSIIGQTDPDEREEEVERSIHVTFAENGPQRGVDGKDLGDINIENSTMLVQPSSDSSHMEDPIQTDDRRKEETSNRLIASTREPTSFEPADKAASQGKPENTNELFDVNTVEEALGLTCQTPDKKLNWPSNRPNRPDIALETSGSTRKTIRFDSQQVKGRNREWGTGKGIVARLQDGSPKVDPDGKIEPSHKPTEGLYASAKSSISMNKLSSSSKYRAKQKKKPRSLRPPGQEDVTPTSESAKRQRLGENRRSPKNLQNTSVPSLNTPKPRQEKDPNRKSAIIHFDASGPQNQGQISAKKLTNFNENDINVGENTGRTHQAQEDRPVANLRPKGLARSGELIQPSRPEIPKLLGIELGEDDQTFPTSLPPPDSHLPKRVEKYANDDEHNGGRTDLDQRFKAPRSCESSTAKSPAKDVPDKTLCETALVTREPNIRSQLPAHYPPRIGSTLANRTQSQTYITDGGSPIQRSQTSLVVGIASSVSTSSPASSAVNENSEFFAKQVVIDRNSISTDAQTVDTASRRAESNVHLRNTEIECSPIPTEPLNAQREDEAISEQAHPPKFCPEPQQEKSNIGSRILRELYDIKQHLRGKEQIDRPKRKRPDALSPTTPAMDADTTLVDHPETPRPKKMKQARFESSISSMSAATPQPKASARERSVKQSKKADPPSEVQEHRKITLMLIEMCRVGNSTCERLYRSLIINREQCNVRCRVTTMFEKASTSSSLKEQRLLIITREASKPSPRATEKPTPK